MNVFLQGLNVKINIFIAEPNIKDKEALRTQLITNFAQMFKTPIYASFENEAIMLGVPKKLPLIFNNYIKKKIKEYEEWSPKKLYNKLKRERDLIGLCILLHCMEKYDEVF